VPQDRQGRFSTALFERYQRSEKALVGALAEMYVQGVSTGLPLTHHKHMKSTNMLERLNQEIKRRTRVSGGAAARSPW
jgi:transposase-like protein